MKEQKRHREAFEYYYSMPNRSLLSVARKFTISKQSILKWNKAFNWQKRIKERDVKIKAKTETKAVDTLSNMKTEWVKILKYALGKAITALKNEEFESAESALKAIDTIMRLMIEILGLGQHIVTTEDVHTIIQKLVIVINQNVKDESLKNKLADRFDEVLSE